MKRIGWEKMGALVLATFVAIARVDARPATVGNGPDGPSPSGPARAELEKLPSAREELDRATALKLAVRNTTGDPRNTARDVAVRAYQVVREHWPSETAVASEASFRAGELLRSGGDLPGALAEMKWVREHGGESPFRVRAVLEIGHVERRAKHPQEALAAYESVLSDRAASQRQKDDASLWAGTVYAETDRAEDARRAWQRVADGGEDPLDRVRAFDLLALAAVEKGDLEGAAGVLDRCREALADASGEETKLGERVRSAITSMRAHDELQRAITERERDKKAKPTRS